MFVPFDEMPDHARIWVYVASRTFTSEEELLIQDQLQQFVAGWETHGQAMSGSYALAHHRVILLAADEKFLAASGCSIDKQVHLIKKLETELQVSLLDKLWVYVYQDENLKAYPLNGMKAAVNQGEVKYNSLVLNNLCQNIGEWKSQSLVPANQTWTKRYFTHIQV